jgi:hypothetical protein
MPAGLDAYIIKRKTLAVRFTYCELGRRAKGLVLCPVKGHKTMTFNN